MWNALPVSFKLFVTSPAVLQTSDQESSLVLRAVTLLIILSDSLFFSIKLSIT